MRSVYMKTLLLLLVLLVACNGNNYTRLSYEKCVRLNVAQDCQKNYANNCTQVFQTYKQCKDTSMECVEFNKTLKKLRESEYIDSYWAVSCIQSCSDKLTKSGVQYLIDYVLQGDLSCAQNAEGPTVLPQILKP